MIRIITGTAPIMNIQRIGPATPPEDIGSMGLDDETFNLLMEATQRVTSVIRQCTDIRVEDICTISILFTEKEKED